MIFKEKTCPQCLTVSDTRIIYARKGYICCCVPGWDWLLGGRVWVSGTKTNSRKKASYV